MRVRDARHERIEREQMMYFNKPAAVLSVPCVEIEVTNFTREPSCHAQHSVALPFHQFAIAFSDTVHSRE